MVRRGQLGGGRSQKKRVPTTLEAWIVPAYKPIDKNIHHTFVYCPEKDSHFYCFDPAKLNIESKGAKKVCTSRTRVGNYCMANRYRFPFVIPRLITLPDTARIGIYGVNGVCHQATNCFLKAGGASLSDNLENFQIIKGYAMSTFGYSEMGTNKSWRKNVFDPAAKYCGKKEGFRIERKKREVQKNTIKAMKSLSINKRILAETKKNTSNKNIGIDNSKFEDNHKDLLEEKDAMLKLEASIDEKHNKIQMPQNLKAEALSTKMNDLMIDFQKALSLRIGAEKFEQMTGSKDFLNIIDPEIAVNSWKNFN
ncbi:MAG: hypothetical protein GY699_02545 [Desulfobacteraceae bacterium]|nr:hypothetical protein [Desulfobacteraceae bacterium]